MIFQEFRKVFFDLACFSTNQVYSWREGFDKNNFGRWVKQGLIIRLKPGLYSFPEYLGQPGFEFFIANKIYRPSYISLHSALSFYGMIPEAVVQVTSVTSLKTYNLSNSFGSFSFKSMKPELLFGYEMKPMPGNRTVHIAEPEKALLDLLYLYPFYNTPQELEGLRLDDDYLLDSFKTGRMLEYVSRFRNKALESRLKVFLKTYRL